MDRSSIEQLLLQAAREPTSLRTVLDDAQALYETTLVPLEPEPERRRKRDVRTIRRKRNEYSKRARELGIIKPEDSTLRRDFHKLRNEVLRRKRGDNKEKAGSTTNWDWELSLDEWLWMWFSCPAVVVGLNVTKPAWKARGRNIKKDVQLKRMDSSKPFEINNIQIVRGKEVLYSG